MTERVDLDRLADYVGGALDGTPDADEVRGLVDADPAWAAAHEELASAMASVGADLRVLGQAPEPAPAAVVARLDDALRHLGSSENSAPGGPLRVIDGGRAGAAPRRERKRKTARWAAGLSAAAAVIAFGVGVIATVPDDSGDASGSSAEKAFDAPAAAPTPAAGGVPPLISGRDYRSGSFGGLGALAQQQAPMATGERASDAAKANALESTLPPGSEPPELVRFRTAPTALRDCLDAVRAAFGGRVRVVDLARYEGTPAVVVLLDDAPAGGGRPLVVAAGQDCGTPPGTTDELFHGPLV